MLPFAATPQPRTDLTVIPQPRADLAVPQWAKSIAGVCVSFSGTSVGSQSYMSCGTRSACRRTAPVPPMRNHKQLLLVSSPFLSPQAITRQTSQMSIPQAITRQTSQMPSKRSLGKPAKCQSSPSDHSTTSQMPIPQAITR